MDGRLTKRFRVPSAVKRAGIPLLQPQCIELLGRLLVEHDKPLRARAAAAIVLLYAQPFTRIVRLTVEDVITEDDRVLLRLGETPSPVPGPVAELLLEWVVSRTNMNTATNRESRWLFPGRRAGQPMHPEALSATSESPTSLPARQRSASSFSRCPPRSSPTPSATTTGPQPGSPPRPVASGPATPPDPEQDRHRAGNRTHPATVEYATSPV